MAHRNAYMTDELEAIFEQTLDFVAREVKPHGEAWEEAGRVPREVLRHELPEGERVNLTHGERQIELIRQGDHVTARLLWCTHQGCTVAWLPDEQVYLCPCHDGRFDAEGHPIYGPPRRDLDLLPVTIENGDVIVDV